MVIQLLQRAACSADPRAARVDLEAALRAANDRLWVARQVARIYREQLGDQGAAREVVASLTPLTCIEWRLTAAAWIELGDMPAATLCLERGVTNARIALDMCTIASGYRDAGYTDEARLLVDGAAAIATRAHEAWIVANTFRAFGERGTAIATLERGLRDATTVPDIVTFAHAFATYHARADVLATQLALAERHATSVRDWLEIAIAYHRLVLDETAALRCIHAARGLATSAQDAREIAITRGRVRLALLDDDRPWLPPAKLLAAGARAFAWDRDPARLLGWLRARLPRTSIDALTRPSQFFVNDDLVALLEIQKTGHVPHPLPAYLDILVEVARSTGPNVDHLQRGFACALVCIDDAAATVPEGTEAAMAALLESCLVLGDDAVAGALALFGALADAFDATHATSTMGYLVLFAELGLVLAAAWLDPTDPRIAPTVAQLVEDERTWNEAHPRGPAWLLGDATRHALWRDLAAQILVHPSHRELAARLAGSDATVTTAS
ncbi:MAG: hypothetical protein M3619_23180 [Myxococcota bacterium]|nr:hypothetical protein [Myxococcota bacterium]